MDLKDTTREEEPKQKFRATEKEAASKVLNKVIGRKEEEKVVVTREHVLNAVKSVTRRRLGRWDLKVWPRSKKGVRRRRMEKKPKLAAANGTKIEVHGEAALEFERGGSKCGMRFLDIDVRKPLAALSAINDEGNTVVFSRK